MVSFITNYFYYLFVFFSRLQIGVFNDRIHIYRLMISIHVEVI